MRQKYQRELILKPSEFTEIASQVSFGSPSYFTKCFRKQYGLTPGVSLA